jgi:sugar lactone lactonase YvrE
MTWQALPGVAPCLLGESPLWHPAEQVLYWCDIPGKALHRFDPRSGAHRQWPFDSEPSCCVPLMDGGLLLSLRCGLVRFDVATGASTPLPVALPYDPAVERFNDGKADPQGRFWVGTIYEPRQPPKSALYRLGAGRMDRMAGDITVSNGLAWSPDGGTMYWSDTKAHRIFAFDFDGPTAACRASACSPSFRPRRRTAVVGLRRPPRRRGGGRRRRLLGGDVRRPAPAAPGPDGAVLRELRCRCAARRCPASAGPTCARCT